MKISYFYIYLILVSLSIPAGAYNQANVADQDFIDNADQFSNENGVRIFSGDTNSQVEDIPVLDSSFDGYNDPNEVPVAKSDSKNVVSNNDDTNKKVSSIGFSFSHMANKSKKKVVIPKINQQKVGFSFFQMAKNSKKIPTENNKLND